jgi:hypothetical protein
MSLSEQLDSINNKTFKIGIIGLGLCRPAADVDISQKRDARFGV